MNGSVFRVYNHFQCNVFWVVEGDGLSFCPQCGELVPLSDVTFNSFGEAEAYKKKVMEAHEVKKDYGVEKLFHHAVNLEMQAINEKCHNEMNTNPSLAKYKGKQFPDGSFYDKWLKWDNFPDFETLKKTEDNAGISFSGPNLNDWTIGDGFFPTFNFNEPSSSTQGPSSASQRPSSTQGPSTSNQGPSSSGEGPSSSIQGSSSTYKGPTFSSRKF